MLWETFRKLHETFSRSIRELSCKDLKYKHGNYEWGGLGFLYMFAKSGSTSSALGLGCCACLS